MAKVYVMFDNPRMDFRPAESFGDLVYLTEVEHRPGANPARNDRVLLQAYGMLAEYNPDTDYLIPTGGPVLIGILTAWLYRRLGNRPNPTSKIRFLSWDNRAGEYIEYQHVL